MMQRHENCLLLILLSVSEHVVQLLVDVNSELVGVCLLKGVAVLLYYGIGFPKSLLELICDHIVVQRVDPRFDMAIFLFNILRLNHHGFVS